MAWVDVKVHTDPETGITIKKQQERRERHGTRVRFVVSVSESKYIVLSRAQLFNMADVVGDICDMIENEEF
jgi:hypothetical protein